ncbi:MAG: hypothetical protein WC871_10020, partial [Bacteroidales bacterium]
IHSVKIIMMKKFFVLFTILTLSSISVFSQNVPEQSINEAPDSGGSGCIVYDYNFHVYVQGICIDAYVKHEYTYNPLTRMNEVTGIEYVYLEYPLCFDTYYEGCQIFTSPGVPTRIEIYLYTDSPWGGVYRTHSYYPGLVL